MKTYGTPAAMKIQSLTPWPLLIAMGLFLFFLRIPGASGQYFTLGTDPASVKWNQVKTRHFRVIYPRELDSQAVYVANALEYFHRAGAASMKVSPRNWPVLLHNRTVISNAFVPYAPKRIEFVTTPPQDQYPQAWLDQLVIHEYRHAVQYTAVNRGLTRAFSVIFGQQAVPAVIGLFIPLWFIEGDAVVTETANSFSGRGRVPVFEMKLRAQFLEKGIYSYDKAVNESYRDFTPDRYELGYQLVGRTRTEFGRETWEKIVRKTGNIPLMMVPFSNTLYRQTGYGKSRLYRHVTSAMKSEWSEQDRELLTSPAEPLLVQPGRLYTNRTQPVALGDGSVYVRRTSIGDISRITRIDASGGEHIIKTTGSMTDESLSGGGNRLCWSEIVPDPRWDLRSHSVIRILELETGKIRSLQKKTRYFSPDLSRDGKQIVAVEVDEQTRSWLVVLSAEDGTVARRFPAPGDWLLSYPAWSADGREIAVIAARSDGKALAMADAESGEFRLLTPFSETEISKPACHGDLVLFTGAYDGIDNIYAFDLNTEKLVRVTKSRFGATDAATDGVWPVLYFSDYTARGYRIVGLPLDLKDAEVVNPAAEAKFPLADQLTGQENFIYFSDSVPDSAYTIKPYRKAAHLFNLHSWAPLAVDIDNMNVNPGVTLLSQNLTGTSYASLGYEWDLNEEAGRFFANYRYEGLYPTLDLTAEQARRRGVHTDNQGVTDEFQYNETTVSVFAGVPLAWNTGSFFTGVNPSLGYSYKFLKMAGDEELEFRKDRIHSLEGRVFAYMQSRRSKRDLQPRWGQQLELNYKFTPADADTSSSIFSAEALFYLPGLARHHGTRIYAGYQERVSTYYRYAGQINAPRGYSGLSANRALSFSGNYVMPLACPDINLGPVIYLKRIKAAVFYDGMIDLGNNQEYYQSVGLDLTFDFHLFRLFAPLEAGLRTIYLPGENDVVFEFLYRLNLEGIY